jgi:hypothetical protein
VESLKKILASAAGQNTSEERYILKDQLSMKALDEVGQLKVAAILTLNSTWDSKSQHQGAVLRHPEAPGLPGLPAWRGLQWLPPHRLLRGAVDWFHGAPRSEAFWSLFH